MRLKIDKGSMPKVLLIMDSSAEAEDITAALVVGKFANSIIHLDDETAWKDQLREEIQDQAPKLIIADEEVVERKPFLQNIRDDTQRNHIALIILSSPSGHDRGTSSVSRPKNGTHYLSRPFVFESFMQTLPEMGYYLMIVNRSPK
jgi:hypothetical protein